jgi:hypothetical protein
MRSALTCITMRDADALRTTPLILLRRIRKIDRTVGTPMTISSTANQFASRTNFRTRLGDPYSHERKALAGPTARHIEEPPHTRVAEANAAPIKLCEGGI